MEGMEGWAMPANSQEQTHRADDRRPIDRSVLAIGGPGSIFAEIYSSVLYAMSTPVMDGFPGSGVSQEPG